MSITSFIKPNLLLKFFSISLLFSSLLVFPCFSISYFFPQVDISLNPILFFLWSFFIVFFLVLLTHKQNKKQISLVEENSNFWKTQTQHLTKVNEAYSRFVPNEFLSLLEKDSMLDVKLGDHIQKEMTILFSDIRQFTEMSERMTPQENFNFLNSYLEIIGPIIRKHNGFIDKYIGDAIMALFAGDPDNALQAAIEMQEELRLFNFERALNGLDPVKVGIGIHTGNLILGTIGEKERMEGTVIADAVNLASRIESLTKEYYTSILISEFSVRKMKDSKKFLLREIDYVVVKGKSNVITVLECFDVDPKDTAEKKKLSTPYLFAGLFNFQSGNYEEALQNFIAVQDISLEDPIPVLHIKRCQDILANFANNPYKSEINPSEIKIMIIDDNEAILKLIEKILKKNKYQTMLCESGKVTLRKLPMFQADVFLVDLQLPDIDGLDLVEKIKANLNSEISNPIFIITTGEKSENHLLRANDLGIRDFLRKPIDFKELMDVIHKRLVEINKRKPII
ncbi:MAG: response regulator [Leptospiraceae bacterium]|nr:response regulator [Leptospiraceae bacterium]